MEMKFLDRLWKQMLLMLAVVLITGAIALARDIPCPVRFKELVVIDPKVFYHERIVDKLLRNARVVFLSGDTTGLDEITKILAREKDIRVLRIFSHGAPGQLFLNEEVIDDHALDRCQRALQTWSRALTHDADILLYGCGVADTEKGREFVNRLARYTDADVAASTNRTGGPENEWSLEYATGPVEAAALRMTGYPYYLATYTVTESTDDGTGLEGSLSWAINESNASTGVDDTILFALTSGSSVTLEGALPAITDSVTIDGDNSAGSGTDITVNGGGSYQIFNIASGQVTIENMTLTEGYSAGQGGGISHTGGTLTLDDVTVSGCDALGNGDGIYSQLEYYHQ